MLKQKNTKKQGDVGLGAAIAWFTRNGITVSLPLTDSQDYDLIVDDGSLKRVQVKTTSYKNDNGKYTINLSVKGGNQSFNTIKYFDNTKVELVFILTEDGQMFSIPASVIEAKGKLTICDKYQRYKL